MFGSKVVVRRVGAGATVSRPAKGDEGCFGDHGENGKLFDGEGISERYEGSIYARDSNEPSYEDVARMLPHVSQSTILQC